MAHVCTLYWAVYVILVYECIKLSGSKALGSGLAPQGGVFEHQGTLVYTGGENLTYRKDEDCFEYNPTL